MLSVKADVQLEQDRLLKLLNNSSVVTIREQKRGCPKNILYMPVMHNGEYLTVGYYASEGIV